MHFSANRGLVIVSAGVSSAKIADKMAHTEDSVVVYNMSVCATLKITPNLFHVQLSMYLLNYASLLHVEKVMLSRRPSSRQAVRGLGFQEICSSTCTRAWGPRQQADVSAAG